MVNLATSKISSQMELNNVSSETAADYFGALRRAFLMEHRRPVFYCLLTYGQLDTHLKAIGSVAEAEMDRQTARLEALHPGADPLAIRDTAERIVMDELICC